MGDSPVALQGEGGLHGWGLVEKGQAGCKMGQPTHPEKVGDKSVVVVCFPSLAMTMAT